MSKLRILWIGRRAKDPLVAAADDYLTRLNRYSHAELLTLREGSSDEEAKRIEAKLGSNSYIIALDERGKGLSSQELADRVVAWRDLPHDDITFVIGGADGLHSSIKGRADETWSLSRMTLPHRLALALLLEQLYRAHTIVRGEKYHRV